MGAPRHFNGLRSVRKMDWTSLMGDEKKKLLRTLPDKLESNTEEVIHQDTAETVIKIWKVLCKDALVQFIICELNVHGHTQAMQCTCLPKCNGIIVYPKELLNLNPWLCKIDS